MLVLPANVRVDWFSPDALFIFGLSVGKLVYLMQATTLSEAQR